MSPPITLIQDDWCGHLRVEYHVDCGSCGTAGYAGRDMPLKAAKKLLLEDGWQQVRKLWVCPKCLKKPAKPLKPGESLVDVFALTSQEGNSP